MFIYLLINTVEEFFEAINTEARDGLVEGALESKAGKGQLRPVVRLLHDPSQRLPRHRLSAKNNYSFFIFFIFLK
jgi:hypothetical protein